jgi:streptogramin lyase
MQEFCLPEIAEADAAQDKLSRREFARRAAVAATTALILPASLLAQETAAKPTSSIGQTPQPAAALSPELQAEGELKYQWIIQTYGKRLNEEQKQDLHRLVMEGQKPLAAFRAFPLENSDQPATVLKFTDVESSEGSRD